ncbi:MAG: hypothetical protein IT204_09875 [Fimbriimonadaceae bacterium]|nr:hypothetical protein [Fimbriimonadaceae bacterium]
MSWFDRLKKAAEDVVAKAAEGADKAGRYVAAHGPGVLGESAAELVAEKDYLKARQLAASGLTRELAAEVRAQLLPHWQIDGTRVVQINRLLGDAWRTLGEPRAAVEHFATALSRLRDPLLRSALREILIDEEQQVDAEYELALLLVLARANLEAGQGLPAYRYALEAIAQDARCGEALYLQGAAMLQRGLPPEAVLELYLKAASVVGVPTALGWVQELLPDRVETFRSWVG